MTNDAKKITDFPERERALDPERSFIVEAPAGSGKTGLLMQRFLLLLSTVEKPEELLALTFTKKAAGEMQKRIMESLYSAFEAKEVFGRFKNEFEKKTFELARNAVERDITLGWNLLENPGRLRIQTIDSLSASFIRQMPLLSRAGRGFTVAEDATPFYREAAKRTVEMVEGKGVTGSSVRTALRRLDNSVKALTERLVIMLGKRDQWLRHVRRGDTDAELKERLEGGFRNIVEDTLKDASLVFPKARVKRLFESARYAALNLEANGVESPVRGLMFMNGLPAPSSVDLPKWQAIAELLLTNNNQWRKPKGVTIKNGFPPDGPEARARKRDFQELLEEIEGDDTLLRALTEARALPLPAFDPADWEVLLAFLHLLPAAQEHLMKVFDEEGVTDFQHIALSALSALGDDSAPTDLMLSLDLKIKHILVDEYQDTSRVQLALLKALTRGWTEGDGRTLFIVGDPMQSIYMFREAEVGLFLDARLNGVGEVRLNPIKLRSNFRSGDEIVSWVNAAFSSGGAFPEKEDIFTGSIRYTPSLAARGEIEGSRVEVALFDGRLNKEEAEKAVGIIKGIYGKAGSEDPGTTAVLCRSRNHLLEVVTALKKEGMTFRAEAFDPLTERTVVQDILSLLRAVLHPLDRVAWLAALRAPWCGAALNDLLLLCKGDNYGAVLDLASDPVRLASLSEDGRTRVPPVIERIKKARSMLGRTDLRGLIEGLWTGLGGPACVAGGAMKDAEAFFDSIGSMREGEAALKGIEERVEGLYAFHGGSKETRIDLMTVHRAKGLEFDNVIIPGLGKEPRNEDKKLLLWMERKVKDEDDLLLAPIERKTNGESPLYAYLNRVNKFKASLERTRLFYVAATRARKKLFLLGHANGMEDGEFKVDDRSFLSVIRPVLREEMLVRNTGSEATGVGKEGKVGDIKIRRLPGSWKAPRPAETIRIVERPILAPFEEPEFRWAGERVRHLGTVVHRYLCRIAKSGLLKWDARRVSGEKDRISSELRALGLDEKDAGEFSGKAIKMLSDLLGDARGRWVLGDHRESGVEVGLTGVVNNELVHVIIDRTFVDDDNVRWVIDYKTSLHEGGDRAEFLASEKERYRGQLERYAAILSEAGGGEREIKKGLYYPALLEFVEV